MKSQTIGSRTKIKPHDLRTPMNAILGFSKLAKGVLSKEEAFIYNRIYKAALKLQRVLDKAMNISETDYTLVSSDMTTMIGKALVVDDDLMNREVAKMMLGKFGLKVDVAEDGVSALEAISSKKYDVILMDLQMPGADGFITTKVIRNKGVTDIPIIALTADISSEARKKCSAVGMSGYLTKPIIPTKLHSTLEQWLR